MLRVLAVYQRVAGSVSENECHRMSSENPRQKNQNKFFEIFEL